MSNTNPNNTITTTLTDLGLGLNEAKLYEILLNNPDATIPLLKQKSPFSRTMLYYILESLEGYELIEKKEVGKKTVYNAAPPEKLEEMFNEQEKELKLQKQKLGAVIGDLRGVYNLTHNKPGVRFFEGINGIKEALWDSLEATETIYTFINREKLLEIAGPINAKYLDERLKRKIGKKTLYLDTPAGREFINQHADDIYSEARLLPPNAPMFFAGMQIYNNKICYFTLRNNEIISVIINDGDLYAMNKCWFELLWNSLDKKNAAPAASLQPTISNLQPDL